MDGKVYTRWVDPFNKPSTVTAGDADINGSIQIVIKKGSTTNTHTLRYQFGSLSGTIANNVDNRHNWILPQNFASEMSSVDNMTGIIFVDSYSGSRKIGTNQTQFTVRVPQNQKPTLGGISLSDKHPRFISNIAT